MRRLVPAIALALGGCSFQLSSLAPKGDADSVEHTGSIGSGAARNQAAAARPGAAPPSEVDLAYARAAAAEVLARGGKDASMPWENPHTGARGNITPLATSYSQAGFTCRDFLASYVRDGSEAWLQGEACRMQGKWEVKSLKPWKRR